MAQALPRSAPIGRPRHSAARSCGQWDERGASTFIAAVYEPRLARCLAEIVEPGRRPPASRESGLRHLIRRALQDRRSGWMWRRTCLRVGRDCRPTCTFSIRSGRRVFFDQTDPAGTASAQQLSGSARKASRKGGSVTKRSTYVRAGRDAAAVRLHAAVTATPHTLSRYCAVDLESLWSGIKPGEGRIHACLQSHTSELSVGCSARLSRAARAAKEYQADIQRLCPHARLWEGCKLREAASWRGQRSLQSSAGVRRLPRQRSATLSDPTPSLLRDWTLPSREGTLKSSKVPQRNRSDYSTHDKVVL